MSSATGPAHVPVAEVVRGGLVEGRHHGTVAALTGQGEVDWSLGAPDEPMYPRSCVKPLQAVAMLRCGLDLDREALALASASHSGEPFHLDGVRRILGDAGLSEEVLRTPPDLPLDDVAAQAVLRAGGDRSSVAMNCSGKHAAMLATCVVNGWDTGSYLDPAHPLQTRVRETVEELTGVPIDVTAVDGCGAPLFATTVTGLARAFHRLAVATDGPEHRVARAIRSYPEWVSGTRRDECDLVQAVPGLIAKAGAEGCYAVALADGRAVALKIEDGAPRARRVVMAAALRRLGVPRAGDDPALFEAAGTVVLHGGGAPVGSVRAVL
jgi:L-asparaginase II